MVTHVNPTVHYNSVWPFTLSRAHPGAFGNQLAAFQVHSNNVWPVTLQQNFTRAIFEAENLNGWLAK
eukprot:12414404-Karenia_brevis.AAC.1